MEKVRVSKEIAVAINLLKRYGSTEDILEAHEEAKDLYKYGGKGWDKPVEILNSVDIPTLRHALQYGFEIINVERPAKVKPHKISIPVTQEKPNKQALELELDYQLASLHDAIQQGNQAEIDSSKKRLAELHKELDLEPVPVLEGF